MTSASNEQSGWVGLKLTPLDVLFFRDGRPFADNVRNRGGLPTPQTLAGALRTAMLEQAGLLQDFLRLLANPSTRNQALELAPNISQAKFRGPWLARSTSEQPTEILLPVPGDLLMPASEKADLVRLRPTRAPSGYCGDVSHPLMLAKADDAAGIDAKAEGGFLNLDSIRQYLAGRTPLTGQVARQSSLFNFETRTGIVVDEETFAAKDENIYSARFLRLERDVYFYAEISADAPVPQGPIRFGGEGRYVAVERVTPVDWPGVTDASKAACRYLASPGLFGGWKLPVKETIVSAAVGSPLAVSGWNNARDGAKGGPRPTRYAAPAGSVYYVNKPSANTKADSFGQAAEEGFGFALPGTWNGIEE